MGANANRRRAALRALFEEWNVPLALLKELSLVTPGSLDGLIAKESWIGGYSTASLHAKMIKSFDRQLVRFSDHLDAETCSEKATRAFAAMAKTLESLTVVGNRIAASNSILKEGEDHSKQSKGADDNPAAIDPNRTADLDRQLAALVQNLS